jgi:hypothetical protein
MEFCVAHWPLVHAWPVPHVRQSLPLAPHAAMAPPDWHSPFASQQPTAQVAGPQRRTGGVHERNATGSSATRTKQRMEFKGILSKDRPCRSIKPGARARGLARP